MQPLCFQGERVAAEVWSQILTCIAGGRAVFATVFLWISISLVHPPTWDLPENANATASQDGVEYGDGTHSTLDDSVARWHRLLAGVRRCLYYVYSTWLGIGYALLE